MADVDHFSSSTIARPIDTPGSGGVFVVVLNWNGADDTLACLDTLSRMNYRPLRIAVVDNGSHDDSVERIRLAFPDVLLIETGRNLGYAGGNNVGIRRFLEDRSEEFVFVLNNDTLVDPDCITRLVEAAAAAPQGGIFGPKILFHSHPRRIWFAGGRWSRLASAFSHVGSNANDSPIYDTPGEVDFITGCAMLIRRSVLETNGPFDEAMFLMFEDCDLSYRVKRAGWSCVYVPPARLWHRISASFGGHQSPLWTYFFTRNRLLFAERHLGFGQRLRVWWLTLVELVLPEVSRQEHIDTTPLRKLYWFYTSNGWRSLWQRKNYRGPAYAARWIGVRDYLRRRFGDCAASTRIALSSRRE